MFLISTSVTCFYLSGFESKAKTALIMGGGSASVMWILSFCSSSVSSYSTHAASLLRILSIGRTFMAVLLATFCWRAYLIRNVPEKMYLFNALVLLSIGSLFTWALSFIAIQKPKEDPKKVAKFSVQ